MPKKHLKNSCLITAKNISALVDFVRSDIKYRLYGDEMYYGYYNAGRKGHLKFILNLCVIHELLLYMKNNVFKSRHIFNCDSEIFMKSRRPYNHGRARRYVNRYEIFDIIKSINNYFRGGVDGPWKAIKDKVIKTILHNKVFTIGDMIDFGFKIIRIYDRNIHVFRHDVKKYARTLENNEIDTWNHNRYHQLNSPKIQDKFGPIHKILWLITILKYIHDVSV